MEEYVYGLKEVSWKIHTAMPGELDREVSVVCGMPEGGKALAVMLAYTLSVRYIFPEKKINLELSKAGSKEVSDLVFDRHELHPGDVIMVVEDVVNNFSTTDKFIALAEEKGAKVAGIACFLNRSDFERGYLAKNGLLLPVISVVRKKLPQYEQEIRPLPKTSKTAMSSGNQRTSGRVWRRQWRKAELS